MADLAKVKTSILTTNSQFEKIVSKRAASLLKRVIADKIKKGVRQVVIDTFMKHLKESPILHALVGAESGDQRGADLQAEFGLDQITANAAVGQILATMNDLRLIRVKPIGTQRARSALIEIEITGFDDGLYKSKLLSIPEGSYTSPRSGEQVPWMSWLLSTANSMIPGYGIAFDEDVVELDTSRSGRAVMTSNERKANLADGRFPYLLPKKYVSVRGDDFIQDILIDRKFKKQVRDNISEFLTKEIQLRVLKR